MGTSKKVISNKTCTVKPVHKDLHTPKGNKLFQFSTVTDEERKRLRVDAYSYII